MLREDSASSIDFTAARATGRGLAHLNKDEANSSGTHYYPSGSSVQREEALQGMIFLDNR